MMGAGERFGGWWIHQVRICPSFRLGRRVFIVWVVEVLDVLGFRWDEVGSVEG